MNSLRSPVVVTILFGLGAAAVHWLASIILRAVLGGPQAFGLVIWGLLGLYGLLLARWTTTPVTDLLYPLSAPLVFFIWGGPLTAFLVLAVATLAWIRSGLCYRGRPGPGWVAELITIVGGGLAVAYLAPRSGVEWTLGIWLFFLIQSIYFLIRPLDSEEIPAVEADPFDAAWRKADQVLKENRI